MKRRNVTVVGLQWGDEGKGKIVDWLSRNVDIVVRFQGGHNAGHTLMVDKQEYILSLIPSGVLHDNTISMIGSGVVVDPWALRDEIAALVQRGIDLSPLRLRVAENATMILPSHRLLDQARESARGSKIGTKIGTTGRGIGPAYEDKIARRAVRIGDLADAGRLREKLDETLFHHNAFLKGLGEKEVEAAAICDELLQVAPDILPFVDRVWDRLYELQQQEKVILFEGAQGTMLDIEYGTYPYVTSSNTVAAQASIGSGVGVGTLGYILGIAKAYTTRVGGGPFPTELDDDTGAVLFERGREFGAVTKRQRRCGWFDAVLTRYACRLSGVDGIALTKIDILDHLDEIKICIGYESEGERIDYYPSTGDQVLTPIYETFPGWKCNTRGITRQQDMPKAMRRYVDAIAKLMECEICLISTSPRREDTIVLKDPLGIE